MEEPIYPPDQAPLPMDTGYGMQPQMIPSQADLVEKITPRKLAEEIEHKLKGEVYDYDKEKWIKLAVKILRIPILPLKKYPYR